MQPLEAASPRLPVDQAKPWPESIRTCCLAHQSSGPTTGTSLPCELGRSTSPSKAAFSCEKLVVRVEGAGGGPDRGFLPQSLLASQSLSYIDVLIRTPVYLKFSLNSLKIFIVSFPQLVPQVGVHDISRLKMHPRNPECDCGKSGEAISLGLAK